MSFGQLVIAALAIVLFHPDPAHAELGGSVSILAAKSSLAAAPQETLVALSGYTRHDTIRENGGVVRQFVNATGQVFAVTWSGPGKPDLRALLGPYFTMLQAPPANGPRAMHSLRRPAQVDRSDVQMQTSGHMGWFHGTAFLPALAPAAFARADLVSQP